MISPDFLRDCVEIAVRRSAGSPIYPTTPLPDPPLGAHTHSGAHSDFYGLPSNPISIYHTGDLCPKLIDPDAWRVSKETWPICNHWHPIAPVWRELGRQVYEYFDSVAVKWMSIDPVRFAEVGRNAQAGPLFLWVGVMPGTLSRDDAEVAAVGCKDILAQSQITDVEIAFRESVFTRSAGPQLLDYISHIDPNVDVRGPFTPALGLQIAAKATPHIEGTGGLYICEGGESDRVFVLTTRHVVFPPSAYRNDFYSGKKKGQPHPGVILLGSRAYQGALKSIMGNIGSQAILIECHNDELEGLGEAVEGEDATRGKKREKVKVKIKEAEKSIEILDEFHGMNTKFWSAESQRVVGHVAYAPPISVGTGDKCYTEDWALIELHREKINDWKGFKGNVLRLGTKISRADYMYKMFPQAEARDSLKYPRSGFLELRDVVKEDELGRQTVLDTNGEECITVVKNGNATGVTIGRGSGIESFVREYDDNGIRSTSMQVAIYPYGQKDDAFSAPGDSGSVVVDGKGGIVGVIIGGAGQADSTDVTYLSPFYWVWERIKAVFPDAHLYPNTPG